MRLEDDLSVKEVLRIYFWHQDWVITGLQEINVSNIRGLWNFW